jgi:HPr kinase/phosphorylase
MPYRKEAEVKLLIELASREVVPRMPPSPLSSRMLCGIDVPILLLWPFEASAPLKLRLALQTHVW